jgi:hypothetical protein
LQGLPAKQVRAGGVSESRRDLPAARAMPHRSSEVQPQHLNVKRTVDTQMTRARRSSVVGRVDKQF